MEIRVYNTSLEQVGIVDEIQSLIWHPKYWNVGSVQLLVPVTQNNLDLLVDGAILIKHYDGESTDDDIDTDGKWRRAAQINYRCISTDTDGAETIEVQAEFLSGWISRRVILDSIVAQATCATVMERIVRENMGDQADSDRQFEQFEILTTGDLGGSLVEYSHSILADAGTEVHDRAVAGKLGYDILVNERTRKYGFQIYKGNDFTQTNSDGNNPCVFSQEFDNISTQEFIQSSENCKNVTYVAGAEQEDGTVTVIEVGSGEGMERREVYTDGSALEQTYTEDDVEITMSTAEFLQLLYDMGEANLSNYDETISFSSEINTDSNLTYRTDFDVGDQVTCISKRWGIKIDLRITEVEEVSEQGSNTLNITFGESLPELIDKIRRLR